MFYLIPQVIFIFINITDQDFQGLVLPSIDIAMLVADRPSNQYVGAVNDPDALVHIVAVGKADGCFMGFFTPKKNQRLCSHCLFLEGKQNPYNDEMRRIVRLLNK